MASGQPVQPNYPTPTGGNTTAAFGSGVTYTKPGWFVVREGELGNVTNAIAKGAAVIGKILTLHLGQAFTMKTTGQWTVKYVSDREAATVLTNMGRKRYATRAQAQAAADSLNNKSAYANPLGGLAGDLAAGLEHGVIQVIKDIWQGVEGYAQMLFGAAIAILVLAIYFASSDTGQSLIKAAAGAAMMAL